jgi:uncharacterized protein YkwD
MVRFVRVLVAAIALAGCAFCAAWAGDGEKKDEEKPKKAKFKLTAQEKTVFELTNKEREEANLKPFKLSPLLTKVARAHSNNMASQQKLSHFLDGKGPDTRMKEAGYKFSNWAENIYFGADNPKVAGESVKWWMNSKGHRANILGKNLRETGIGVVRKDGKAYFTQVFGAPR